MLDNSFLQLNEMRIKKLNQVDGARGPVAYWMSRDQRISDNWALYYAQQIAVKQTAPLVVIFCLAPTFLGATVRQYSFMIRGLQEVESNLSDKGIPFYLLTGSPEKEIKKFVERYQIGTLVTDFSPVRISRAWKQRVVAKIRIPFYEVDAHNIVPCWLVSPKQEFAAYTIRPKIHELLPTFLVEFPQLKEQEITWKESVQLTDWKEAEQTLQIDRSVTGIKWIPSGEKAARNILEAFIAHKLASYVQTRNDPTIDGQSNLSPYLHFGQISPQRVALAINRVDEQIEPKAAYLEELIVRRELAENFCFYNQYYNSFEGFPNWAKQTLNEHRQDKRDYVYTLKSLEIAETHDEWWNAAQRQMVQMGKMHGYMRMYWAKKILEWTKTPEDAMKIAIYLNDKYELDGRDPNGYAGIAWAIGGVHDRAWFDRSIYGKVRYMSYNQLERKFNLQEYISAN
jgi:deoxyribodipyrimidine photo-lyase